MARAVFLLLVLVNLVFFILAAGYLGGQDAGHEPERLAGQLQPERLKVTVVAETQSPAAPGTASNGSEAAKSLCRRVGPLAAADAEKLRKALMDKGGTAEVTRHDGVSYWVFIPLQPDKPTSRKAAELREAGITEFFVVDEVGPDKGAISLGLFHKEDAAKDFLQRLTRKGIKSAMMVAKPRVTDKVLLDVRGDRGTLEGLLTGLAAESVDCPQE